MQHLSPHLKSLVDQAVTLLGEVLKAETGPAAFARIEGLRQKMAGLRSVGEEKQDSILAKELMALENLSPKERQDCARAFTLMLELMNACENAYRNYSIQEHAMPAPKEKPDAVIYVLTAHPTEARSPANIWVFHSIQNCLADFFKNDFEFSPQAKGELRHLLALAWRITVVRTRKPRVQDEAEHIFSTLLREETLRPLLQASRSLAPVFVRSWVGGDKDGHPGVNEKTFRDSLQLSRRLLLHFLTARLSEVQRSVEMIEGNPKFLKLIAGLRKDIAKMRKVGPGDGARTLGLRKRLRTFSGQYARELGSQHPSLVTIAQLLRMFPALVVPLEFRESSDLLPEAKRNRRATISRMLDALAAVARGGDPRWYVRGMIISMAASIAHVRSAAYLVQRALGGLRIPVIPLFEQAEALELGPSIVRSMLNDKKLDGARRRYWQGYLEVMVGYSDSSKQSGVLASRLKIAESMHKLDRICEARGVVPLFFQGSGGSVDRGGGSIEEQTAWWPAGALRNYKVTVQGEMVERSFASPEITWRQVQRIVASAGRWKNQKRKPYVPSSELKAFAASAASGYQNKIADPDFLRVIEAATPYLFLDRLRIGSRPTKRATTLSVGGLRAIPWVLCWTQTRVLFPTWWGIGTAWANANSATKKALRKAYGRDPVFTVYIRALGYTMAKVEMSVWRLYVMRSALAESTKQQVLENFSKELRLAQNFLKTVTQGNRDHGRLWLHESIALRSPMIHPLNLLQLIALKKNEADLLRMTVTGIANGMVATG
jgi:phosphoenolpyruvate carboxylase